MREYGLVITTPGGRMHRFEDSERFGPNPLRKDGELSGARLWAERNPFWAAHSAWSRQGKRVAEDGSTCIADLPATDADLWRLVDAANAEAFKKASAASSEGRA